MEFLAQLYYIGLSEILFYVMLTWRIILVTAIVITLVASVLCIPGWRNWQTRPSVTRESGRSNRSPGAKGRIL